MRAVFLVVFLFLKLFSGYGLPNPIDSLEQLVKTAKDDTNKVNLYNQLSAEMRKSDDSENSMLYSKKAAELSFDLGFHKGNAIALNAIGVINKDQGNYPEALKNFHASLEIKERIGDKKGKAVSYFNIGNVHRIQGNYSEALENFYKNLKICEEFGDAKGVSGAYGSIGTIYYYLSNYPEALKNYFAALETKQSIGDKRGMASTYNNVGLVYMKQRNDDEALKYFNTSLAIDEEIGNKQGIAASYGNVGLIYEQQGNYQEAIKTHLKSLALYEELESTFGIAGCCINLGLCYTGLSKLEEAEAYFKKALNLFLEIGANEGVKETYSGMVVLDSLKGNYKDAFTHFKLYVKYRDQLVNEETKEHSIKEKMFYEFEKKEAISKLEQEKKHAISQAEILSQKKQRNYFIVGFVLILLFALYMVKSFKDKQKANTLITRQKEEVEYAKKVVEQHQKEIVDSINYAKRIQDAILPSREAMIESLRKGFLLYQPKDIVAGDFYFLETVKTETGSKVVFAACDCTGHGVPGAMVSVVCSNALTRSVKEFGITEPGKILDKTKELVIATFEKSTDDITDGMDASVCTLIRENGKTTLQWAGANNPLWIVRSNRTPSGAEVRGDMGTDLKPSDISTPLDDRSEQSHISNRTPSGAEKPSFDSIRQLAEDKGDVSSPSDFSMLRQSSATTSLEKTNHESHSGASTSSATAPSQYSHLNTQIYLEEVKPDKQPIGKYTGSNQPFTTQTFELQQGDTIYIFTDGMQDQFGGDNSKKLKVTKLKKMLLSTHSDDMDAQKTILESQFQAWKGQNEQVDDICLIGVRI